MAAKIILLKVGGFRVIDEVMALMDPDTNPASYKQCGDLPEMLEGLATRLPQTLETEPWKHVTGSSGADYPIYISPGDPFVVYTGVRRHPEPDEMLVMHVGLRGGRSSFLFYRAVHAEIDRRLKLQGWLL